MQIERLVWNKFFNGVSLFTLIQLEPCAFCVEFLRNKDSISGDRRFCGQSRVGMESRVTAMVREAVCGWEAVWRQEKTFTASW